ncbi:hypothetical protein ACFSKL_06985 [Belliella marina]|uniref:Uncharacterized protein n=1 Tax=Belliella marina TaxID=1644146 RepID=A0ABW4VKK6_9BACT
MKNFLKIVIDNKPKIIMKNLLLFVVVFFCFVSLIPAQNLDWDYAIKPGGGEWSKFTDVQERIKACQIPEEVIPNLSTQRLFRLVLSQPFFLSYGLSNSPVEGFNGAMNSFNGYIELISRSSASYEIINYYRNEDFQKLSFKEELAGFGSATTAYLGLKLIKSMADSRISNLDFEDVIGEIKLVVQSLKN